MSEKPANEYTLILEKLSNIERKFDDRIEDHSEMLNKLSHIVTGNGTPGLCEQVREVAAIHRNLEKRFDGWVNSLRYWVGGTFLLVVGQWIKFLFAKFTSFVG